MHRKNTRKRPTVVTPTCEPSMTFGQIMRPHIRTVPRMTGFHHNYMVPPVVAERPNWRRVLLHRLMQLERALRYKMCGCPERNSVVRRQRKNRLSNRIDRERDRARRKRRKSGPDATSSGPCGRVSTRCRCTVP